MKTGRGKSTDPWLQYYYVISMSMSNAMKCGAFGESAFVRDVWFIVSVIDNVVLL